MHILQVMLRARLVEQVQQEVGGCRVAMLEAMPSRVQKLLKEISMSASRRERVSVLLLGRSVRCASR